MKIMKRDNGNRAAVYRERHPFEDFFDGFAGMFEDYFPVKRSAYGERAVRMDVDIAEDDEKFTLLAALPGMDEDEIKLSVENNRLSLSAEKKAEKEEEGREFYRREIGYGRLERHFAIPDSVDSSAIEASYKNGVVEIVLPKREKGSGSREIKIKSV